MEREATRSLARARQRLAGLNEAIRTERDALLAVRSRAKVLEDENAAPRVLLANTETELMNRATVVLHKMYEDIEGRLQQNPQLHKQQEQLNEMTRQRDQLLQQAVEYSRPVCRLLARLSGKHPAHLHHTADSTGDDSPRSGSTSAVTAANGDVSATSSTEITLRGSSSCRSWALSNYEWLQQAAIVCSSSGALILTTENIDEIYAIVQSCEPLKTLRTQHLIEAQQHLRVEEERHERLVRVGRQHRVGLNKYGENMYRYLDWVQCFNITIGDPTWSVACTNAEARRAYRSTAATEHHTSSRPTDRSFMIHGGSMQATNVEYMRRLIAIAMPSRHTRTRISR